MTKTRSVKYFIHLKYKQCNQIYREEIELTYNKLFLLLRLLRDFIIVSIHTRTGIKII